MKSFRCILVIFLCLSGANAFTTKGATKKREQRNKFQSANIANEDVAPASSPSAPIFALPPSAVASAIALQYGDGVEEDINISYGVALVSCALSLALGFGFGYGV
jgi:hypothetical protein